MLMPRALLILALVCGVAATSAQTPAGPVVFEVASVKVSTGDGPGAGWHSPPRGNVAITNAPLEAIISRAYLGTAFNRQYEFEAPSNNTVLSTRFDIVAKPPDDAAPGQTLAMLKNLLADRFKLRVHTETRQVPVYALTAPRDGQPGGSLRRSTQECELSSVIQGLADSSVDVAGRNVCRQTATADAGMRVLGGTGPIALIVEALRRSSDRPVIDATGLAGIYDWQLRFPFAPGVDAMLMAVEDQLGLRVERRTGPVAVLIVDSVEMPTPD
jgi:uncharacterized protein (TIGR03435 family)